MKNNIPYEEAAKAACHAAVEIRPSDYKCFYEISDGGVQESGNCTGELRLVHDADGRLECTAPRDICAVAREFIECSGMCLNADENGRVCIDRTKKINKKYG